MAERYANGTMEERRLASGFTDATYSCVMEKIQAEYGMVGISLSHPSYEQPLVTRLARNMSTIPYHQEA